MASEPLQKVIGDITWWVMPRFKLGHGLDSEKQIAASLCFDGNMGVGLRNPSLEIKISPNFVEADLLILGFWE